MTKSCDRSPRSTGVEANSSGPRHALHDADRQRPALACGVAEERNGDGGIPAEFLDRSYLDVRSRCDEIGARVAKDRCQGRIGDSEPARLRRDDGGQPTVAALRLYIWSASIGRTTVLHWGLGERSRIASQAVSPRARAGTSGSGLLARYPSQPLLIIL